MSYPSQSDFNKWKIGNARRLFDSPVSTAYPLPPSPQKTVQHRQRLRQAKSNREAISYLRNPFDAQMQKLTASPAGASSRSKAQSKRSEYLDFMSKEMKKANQRWNALKNRKSSSRK